MGFPQERGLLTLYSSARKITKGSRRAATGEVHSQETALSGAMAFLAACIPPNCQITVHRAHRQRIVYYIEPAAMYINAFGPAVYKKKLPKGVGGGRYTRSVHWTCPIDHKTMIAKIVRNSPKSSI